MKLKMESRHSDYGEDAGGYSVLRFDGKWVGRVTDYEAGEKLVEYVAGLERENEEYHTNVVMLRHVVAELERERDALRDQIHREKMQG